MEETIGVCLAKLESALARGQVWYGALRVHVQSERTTKLVFGY